ncbi:MAG: LLM class flavin-dependent oxidoreductase [Acidobacteriota bacterium]|nr:LLM class flavin-dependent oxidoreductase [Blastocatellia bacterium]MDW8240101.1 LLM class flavin-dependent oxidoreductase [Acidobacteriota bacterium]
MSIHFGLALDFWSVSKPLHQRLDEYVQLLTLAEQLGFESVWAGENRPSVPEPGHVPSPLLVLASLARSTRLRLGTGVLLLPLWHPLHLAYDVALLDHLSGGRFVLGVGAGSPALMKRYGIPYHEVGSRMDEALTLLKTLWAGGDGFHGTHFNVKGRLYPAPMQPGGPPIWVGGKIRRSVGRAATLADGWYAATQYHFQLIKTQIERYRGFLAAQGRDPASAVVAMNRTAFVAETDEQARHEGRPYISQVLHFYAQFGMIHDASGQPLDPRRVDLFEAVGDDIYFCGSPQTVLESIRKYQAAGVTHFNLRISPGDMPLALAMRTVTLLGEHVLPQLRH